MKKYCQYIYKKILIAIVIAIMIHCQTFAQIVIFSDDFERFTPTAALTNGNLTGSWIGISGSNGWIPNDVTIQLSDMNTCCTSGMFLDGACKKCDGGVYVLDATTEGIDEIKAEYPNSWIEANGYVYFCVYEWNGDLYDLGFDDDVTAVTTQTGVGTGDICTASSYNYRNVWLVSNSTNHKITNNSLGLCVMNGYPDEYGNLQQPLAGVFDYISDMEVPTDRFIKTMNSIELNSYASLFDIYLEFDWRAGGDGQNDYGMVQFLNPSDNSVLYSFSSSITNSTKFYNQGQTQHEVLSIPENMTSVALAFRFICNTDGQGGNIDDLSFVVDNVRIIACPKVAPKITSTLRQTIDPGESVTITRDDIYASYSENVTYKWQKSVDGVNWVDLIEESSSLNTGTLQETTRYRVVIVANGSCDELVSEVAIVAIGEIPQDCVSPVLTAKANGEAGTVSQCATMVHLTANPIGGSDCEGNWEYLWSAGGVYWNGSDFVSPTEEWNENFSNITAEQANISKVYAVKVRCSANPDCSQSSSVIVNIEKPVGEISAPAEMCSSDATVKLTFPGNWAGTWSGDGVSPSGVFDPATAGAGKHTITYTINVAGCDEFSTSTDIMVSDRVTFNVITHDELCKNENDGSAKLSIRDNESERIPHIVWQYNSNTPVVEVAVDVDTVSNLAPGNYTVFVGNGNCREIMDFTILPGNVLCEKSVYVPNVFNPESNVYDMNPTEKRYHYNKYVHVWGEGVHRMDFTIYDRWGNEVFHTTQNAEKEEERWRGASNEGWDGKINGTQANAGAYVYKLEVTFINGQSKTYKGTINLIYGKTKKPQMSPATNNK